LPKVTAKKRYDQRKQAKNEYYNKQQGEMALRQEDLADMVKEQF